jgi:protein-S-isoprenylcysteine O-methyltransferase Ste14
MEPALSRSGTAWLFFKLAVFTLVAPGSVTVWAPLFWLHPSLRHQAHLASISGIAGCLIILAGVAGYVWCALDFLFQGRGTPAPIDPPKKVVQRGLYKYTRNPMYISILLVLLGESLVFQSRFLLEYAVIVAAIVHLFVYFYEEPTLTKRMGASYAEYQKEVPRWIPRLRVRMRNHAV